MDTISPLAQEDSSGANPSSVKSDDSSPRAESGRGSPPPNCAICLGTCRNKSFTDSCLHQFCFKCLLTWSKVKAECPLCKQNFKSIIHNVRSNHQYEEYMVEQRQTEEIQERMDFENPAAFRRFRYRTTLTLPRRETLAIQRLLMQYPLVAGVLPPPQPAPRRRHHAHFRSTVYRHNLWAHPLPDFTGRFRDCSPEFYRYNDSQLHRLVPWLNRELHYLLNENIGHISYVITRILQLLPQYHIHSPEFREAMQRYFGERTEHFLHELNCFATTPYDMSGYDRNVHYTTDSRISSTVNELISSSDSEASADSDIVVVSSSHPAEAPPGPSRPPAYPQPAIPPPGVVPIETISHSDSDDDSSEVMVVGYIKPPADRTPEVVDLLGSDSDVQLAEPDPEPLVRVSLSLPTPAPAPISPYPAAASPPPQGSPAPTTASRRSTPSSDWRPPSSEPDDSADSASAPPLTPSLTPPLTPPLPSLRRRLYRKKMKAKRKTRGDAPEQESRNRSESSSSRKSTRRRSRSRAQRRRSAERERRPKRKSSSGRGVKSSKRRRSPRRDSGREQRRLRSVVRAMKHSADSSSSGNTHFLSALTSAIVNTNSNSGSTSDHGRTKVNYAPQPGGSGAAPGPSSRRSVDSDSDDDLPLNLTIQKNKTYNAL